VVVVVVVVSSSSFATSTGPLFAGAQAAKSIAKMIITPNNWANFFFILCSSIRNSLNEIFLKKFSFSFIYF
jgi:hypothetical protein